MKEGVHGKSPHPTTMCFLGFFSATKPIHIQPLTPIPKNAHEEWTYAILRLRKTKEKKRHAWMDDSIWFQRVCEYARYEGYYPGDKEDPTVPGTGTGTEGTAPSVKQEKPRKGSSRTFSQEAWAFYVLGIQSIYSIETFREACSLAKKIWNDPTIV